jgi:hypothetical protein
MDGLEINYQIPYFRIKNARGVAMGLITFGFFQFADTYLVKNKTNL